MVHRAAPERPASERPVPGTGGRREDQGLAAPAPA